jgi:hypothetical protein
MKYKQLNTLAGWLVFAIGLVTYLLTVSPTASFWDCGEFIAVSNELEVPHPPGAPLYLLVGRVLASFAPDVESVAYMVNLMSVLASAFTGMLIFWIITFLSKKLIANDETEPENGKKLAIIFAGLVGALASVFADSVWFNAVEAEVYSISSLFTALVFWLMLKWEARADQPGHLRWIILITYVMGLSIGVHLLNLLTIPAMGLIYYFRKYTFKWTGLFAAIGVSVVILGLMNSFIIKNTFELAWFFEKTLVGGDFLDFYNQHLGFSETGKSTGMGLPLGSGVLLFTTILIGSLIAGVWYTQKKKLLIANIALIGTVMVYLGMSSYALILVRADKGTPINENSPSNILYFVKYMKREQYGDSPILYGQMYNSPGRQIETKENNYIRLEGRKRYAIDGKKLDVQYDTKRFFPRMHSPSHYSEREAGGYAYKNYVKNKGENDEDPADDKPTGRDNLAFFWDYQVKHMYIRYFLWNFVGRENDVQDADWESGLAFWKADELPENAANDPSRNHYFALPLLLGLLGLYYHFSKRVKDASVIAALFFFTGLAIILYLNQTPNQPRERDYSYAGSFQAFCIWIGIGVIALYDLLNNRLGKYTSIIVGSISLALIPGLMAAQNWHDHSRAGNYVAPDSAYNLLNSVAENGILFTNGDNDTFPLWYIQEVEGVRPDVRIINLSLLNTDWYIHQLKKPINKSAAIPLTYPEHYYIDETNAVVPVPQNEIVLPVDKAQLLHDGIVTAADTSYLISPLRWKITGTYGPNLIRKQDDMIKNIVENIAKAGWKRPIYFAITIPPSSYMNLTNYFQVEGMAYRVLPMAKPRTQGITGYVDKEKMYDNVVRKFRYRALNDPEIFYDSNIQRMIGNSRGNFIRLALAYTEDANKAAEQAKVERDATKVAALNASAAKDRSRAIEVLDFAQKTVSDEAVPIDAQTLSQYARLYMEAGADAKAQTLAELAIKRATESMRFARSQKLATDERDMNNFAFQSLYMMYRDSRKFNEAKKVADIYAEVGDDETRLQLTEDLKRYMAQFGPADTSRTATQPAAPVQMPN